MHRGTFKLAVKTVVTILLISFYTGISNEIFCQYADIGKDPLGWLYEPHSIFSTEVKMSVKIPLTDARLEYKFDCIAGTGYSSDWQTSNEFKNSDLKPETSYSYVARVRMVGSSNDYIQSTGEYKVTTRRSTNTERSRYIPEIDRAFANGEIELIPIRVTGDKDNRINFCAINRWVEGKADGYNNPAFREEFIEDARHSFRTFIPGDEYAIAPYPEYRDFFNLYAIWWPGMPAYDWKEGLTTVDLDEIRDRLFLPWNIEGRGWVSCLAMLNTDRGGGGAARNIETRTGNAMIAGKETEGFIHEFSHTAPGLPDEYTSNGVWGRGGEGSNTTLDFIRDNVKWRAWIEPDTEVPTPYTPENIDKIGVFEGATHRLHHIYRPTARGCIMGAGSFTGDPDSLCPICVQRTVCRLYMWVNPFDLKYPARDELKLDSSGKVHFVVKPIRTLSGSQKLSWFLNGNEIGGNVTELDVSFEADTEYELECRLVDETDRIRPDLPYVDYPRASVKWIINKSSEEGEIFVGGLNKSWYKTPGSTEQTNTSDSGGNIALSIAEITPSTGSMNNGSIKLAIEGAKAPITFCWSDGKTGEESYRNFLIPGTYFVEIKDAGDSQAYLEFEIERAPDFYIKDLQFVKAGRNKIKVKDPKSEYSYLWYAENIPDYVPVFPNGKYYGSGVSASGKEFKAVATVVENRGGVFIKDTAKNNFSSWIHLKVFQNGDNELPVKFSIDTEQEERFSTILTIKDQKTERITYDDNFQFSTEEVDITWNGIIKDGYIELSENGYLDSNIKLFYSSWYNGKKAPLGIGSEFEPPKSGNYYVAAQDKNSSAISINRVGVAITEKVKRKKVNPISPSKTENTDLLMWLDAEDLNADGKPDGNLFRRGSANGGKSKVGDIGMHFFNYFPNAQNGKAVLSWETIWIQRLSEAVNNYQTIIMVRRESDFSSMGTAPWRELDSLIGIGNYGEKLFAEDISSVTKEGNVWINGNKIETGSATMPTDFYIATYEFPVALNNPFKITDGHWEGEIAEVLVFKSKLSKKERKGIEEYLFRKWLSGVSY